MVKEPVWEVTATNNGEIVCEMSCRHYPPVRALLAGLICFADRVIIKHAGFTIANDNPDFAEIEFLRYLRDSLTKAGLLK